jgi:hypothetical protein
MQHEVKPARLSAACGQPLRTTCETKELTPRELDAIVGGGGVNLWSWYPRKRRADAANNASLRN